MKKVGKTTRPFRYDLNQIPYDYTVEVRNRFKGLVLIDRVPDELRMDVHDIVEETGSGGFPGGSDHKESACNTGDMCLEGPLEKGIATHSSILAWRIP